MLPPTAPRGNKLAFEHEGSLYRLTIGRFPDGSVGEVFLNHEHATPLPDVLAATLRSRLACFCSTAAASRRLPYALAFGTVRGAAAQPNRKLLRWTGSLYACRRMPDFRSNQNLPFFGSNRAYDAVEVSLKSFEGMNLCDVRTYNDAGRRGGLVCRTTKGISVILFSACQIWPG